MNMKETERKTTVIRADESSFAEAARALRDGELVAFPTETVYGLGANALDPDAVRSIFKAKGRPQDNPLIVHVASVEDADKYAVTSPLFYEIARAFMPGPITVILPRREVIPDVVTAGLDSVGVRCPENETARRLIALAGVPVAAPSANTSGRPSPTTAEHVYDDLCGKIPYIIDGGASEFGLESTVVKLENDGITVFRPGAVTADALRCITENVRLAPALTEGLKAGETPVSPGMKYRHYAPAAPLALLSGERERILAFFREKIASEPCAILCYDEDVPLLSGGMLLPIGGRDDISAQAHAIFARLREADKLGVSALYGYLPAKEGLALALYNRLIRAAEHTVISV